MRAISISRVGRASRMAIKRDERLPARNEPRAILGREQRAGLVNAGGTRVFERGRLHSTARRFLIKSLQALTFGCHPRPRVHEPSGQTHRTANNMTWSPSTGSIGMQPTRRTGIDADGMERFDAIIVGAGAAGLSAATCAAALDARTLLLDCADGASSDFARSGGGPAAAGTSFQAGRRRRGQPGALDGRHQEADEQRGRGDDRASGDDACARRHPIPVAAARHGHSSRQEHSGGRPQRAAAAWNAERKRARIFRNARRRCRPDAQHHADERRGSHRPAGRGRRWCAACAPASAARSRPSKRPSRCSPAADSPRTETCLRSSRRRSPMPRTSAARTTMAPASSGRRRWAPRRRFSTATRATATSRSIARAGSGSA